MMSTVPETTMDRLLGNPRWCIPILCLLMTAGALLLVPGHGHAEPLHWNDTIIDTSAMYDNTSIVLEGNLTVVEGGDLTFQSCHLMVNATADEPYYIDVRPGGRVSLIDTEVSAIARSYWIRSSAVMTMVGGSLSGLLDGQKDREVYGIEVDGLLSLTDVMLEWDHFRMHVVGEHAIAMLDGVQCSGPAPVFSVETGSSLIVSNATLAGDNRGPIAEVRLGAHVRLETCTWGYSSAYLDGNGVVVDVAGVWDASSSFVAYACRMEPPSRVGRFYVITGDMTIECLDSSPTANTVWLTSLRGNVTLRNVTVEQSSFHEGSARFLEVAIGRELMFEGTVVHAYGAAPPTDAFLPNVTLHQYYTVDFQLLNETRVPTEGLFLVVETRDGALVTDTLSGPDGWARGVWLRSWTRRGDVFSYEPPHRVEFGDVDYSITTVQVFANTTVVLWNSVDQRDLSLVPDGVEVNDRSPREGDPLDVIVRGSRLIPHTYASGTVNITLLVDGVPFTTMTVDLTLRRDVTLSGINLSEGLHELSVIVDPDDAVLEVNEGGNDEVRIIVEVAARNYTGVEIDYYVRITRISDVDGNEKEPLAPGVIEVEFSARVRYSTIVQRNVRVDMYIDGSFRTRVFLDLTRLFEDEYIANGRLPVNLPEGTFTLELRIDPEDEVDERYENNNADSRTLLVEQPAPQPFLDLWDQPLACLALGAVGLVCAMYMYSRSRGRPFPGMGGQERTLARGTPPPPLARPPPPDQRVERVPLVGAVCPTCGGGRLVGFPEGSAMCQDCKAIVRPR